MQLENLTFGLEIEMTGVGRQEAINLMREGIAEHLNIKSINSNKVTTIDNRIWKIVRDSSITPMIPVSKITHNEYMTIDDFVAAEEMIKTAYIEFVSPKCTIEDWPILRSILKKFRDNGAKVNSSCGIHIHVDATNITVNYLLRFWYVVMVYEPILYKILNIHKQRAQKYCMPMEPNIKRMIQFKTREHLGSVRYDDLKKIWRMQDLSRARYHGFNLENIFASVDKCTVEFRYFNSTLHAGKIRSYLYLIFSLMERAEKMTCIQDVKYRSYNKPNLYQLEKWLYYIGLTDDPNVYKHLKKGFLEKDYFG